ncbi:MAG: hypothetical protein QF535_05465 [Anaerolineales bacterium]|nr:hypothetical protein [Anaerolineales bacterium]
MSDIDQNKLVKGLIISTGVLGIVCAALLVALILRPVVVREVTTDDPGVITYDLGNGRKITAPGTSTVEWEGDINETFTPPTKSRTDSADAVGVGFNSDASTGKLVLEMDFTLPETSIEGGGHSAAGIANLGVKALFTSGATPLYIIAGLAILVGCVLGFWLKAWKIGLGFIVGGVAMIAVVQFFTTYPWVIWILFLVAIGVVAFLLWDYWKKGRMHDTMNAVVAAGESLPDKVKSIFTKNVAAEAAARGLGPSARATITSIKANGGAPKTVVDISREEKELYEDLKSKNGNSTPAPSPQVIVVPAGTNLNESVVVTPPQ